MINGMMDRQALMEWIDQYLLDELKDEELDRFRQRLQSDAGFRQQVEMQQAIIRQTRKVGRVALRQQLREMHQRLALPWPVENPEENYQAAPPPEEQTERDRAGRSPLYAIMAYLALLQAQLRRRSLGRFSYYTIAASISLLLSASLIAYFLYRGAPTSQIARQSSPVSKEAITAHLAILPLEQKDVAPGFGFGGAGESDNTVAVLIYPVQQEGRSYRFDDTLRLYGAFVPARLALRFDPKAEGYALREDSVFYPLQRFRPRQALQPAP
jgi:hypothetical protein